MTPDGTSPGGIAQDSLTGETRESRSAGQPALRRARLFLLWEAAWRGLWPALSLLGLFAALAFLGVFAALPGWLHLLLLVAFALAFAWSAWRLARDLRLPSEAAAERRVEKDSGLVHRPLAALGDKLALGEGDAFSEALWRAHLARMRAALGGVRVGWPRPGVARRDPLALRLLVLLLLALGLASAGGDAARRLAQALAPQLGAIALRTPATLQLWLTPPAYTGLPPIFLRASEAAPAPEPAAQAAVVKIPAGSKVLARVEGGSGVPRLELGERTIAFKAVDDTTYQLEDAVASGDHLVVQQGSRVIGKWAIAVVPDAPPKIAFAAPPARTMRAALRLEYNASDDYGLAGVKAEIRRVGAAAEDPPIELDLPLASNRPKQAHETSFHDLTPHPWAGLPVTIQLLARDEPGQIGRSEPVQMILPERVFNHPVARAIIEQRKELSRDPGRHDDVAAALGMIAARPELYGQDASVFLSLISARARLHLSDTPASIAAVQQQLWDTALAIEDGHLSLAERELRELQQKLMDALEHNAPDKEIEQLIAQLEQAIDRYLQALAQQERQNPSQTPMEKNARTMQMQDLHKLLDQLREMARTGARDAARQLLSQLQDMLENMRAARGNPNGKGQNGGAMGLMRGMDDLIGQQDRLMQRTFRDAQQQGRAGQPGQRQGNGAADQEALRRALGELMRRFGDMAGQIPDALGRAERAMRGATDALNRNAPGEAVDAQSQALEALRQGRQAMLEGLRQQLGQEGDPEALDAFGPSRDPLGRVMPGFGAFDSNDVQIPEHGTVQRARRIQEELQRRAGERQRPEIELDYIERLLKRF
jgi:uncharacterized protein (TIGR02302 family)